MDDEDVSFFRSYCKRNASCPDGFVICDVCFRNLIEVSKVPNTEEGIKRHNKTNHSNKKLEFGCSTCKLKFLCAGDAGKHEYYVHKKGEGWWAQQPAAVEE